MRVEREAAGGGGTMVALPAWYVHAAPWLAGLLAVAAAARGLERWVWAAPMSQAAVECGSGCAGGACSKKDD